MSYLNIATSFAQIKEGNTGIALKEKGDCMVRALAAAADVSYRVSHKFCKDHLGREDNKGTANDEIHTFMTKAEKEGLEIGGKSYKVSVLGREDICNRYKLYGEIVYRKKTLKSFIQDHPKGSYVVLVAGHALTVKDGELYDWNTLKFKPTRKVNSVYKLYRDNAYGKQLQLWG